MVIFGRIWNRPYGAATILHVRFDKAIGEIREDDIRLYTLSVILSHAISPECEAFTKLLVNILRPTVELSQAK